MTYQCQHLDVAKGRCLECGLDVRYGMVIKPGQKAKPLTPKDEKKNDEKRT